VINIGGKPLPNTTSKNLLIGTGSEIKGATENIDCVGSTLVGIESQIEGHYSIGIGNSIRAATFGVYIGYASGYDTTKTANSILGGVAVGYSTTINGNYGVAVGYNSSAGNNGIAIGYNISAAANEIKLGNNSTTSLYLGPNTFTLSSSTGMTFKQIPRLLSTLTPSNNDDLVTKKYADNIVFQDKDSTKNIAIASLASSDTIPANRTSVIIGGYAVASSSNYETLVGVGTKTTEKKVDGNTYVGYNTVVGYGASSEGKTSVSLGYSAHTSGAGGVAIGASAAATADNAIAIGNGVTNSVADTIRIGSASVETINLGALEISLRENEGVIVLRYSGRSITLPLN
jgi:hypothetical protein